MKEIEWNDKISFRIGFWIFNMETDLYFFPFLWRKQFYKRQGFLIVSFGPFLLEAGW